MLQQALDFKTESDYLHDILKGLGARDFNTPTQFKNWSINTVLQHLHYFNIAADLSLVNETAFLTLLNDLRTSSKEGKNMVTHTRDKLDNLCGPALLETWHTFCAEMASRFIRANPKARLKWAGPDMSVLSSITARLMETWAHSQAIYDMLGHKRVDGDHIKNIVVLGNNTFSWTFTNRSKAVPAPRPFLLLTSPSGEPWRFNDESETDYIEGLASEFCQVVTQTRHIKDTDLKTFGAVADSWMKLAQCFAGPPSEPPMPGTRFLQAEPTLTDDLHRTP